MKRSLQTVKTLLRNPSQQFVLGPEVAVSRRMAHACHLRYLADRERSFPALLNRFNSHSHQCFPEFPMVVAQRPFRIDL